MRQRRNPPPPPAIPTVTNPPVAVPAQGAGSTRRRKRRRKRASVSGLASGMGMLSVSGSGTVVNDTEILGAVTKTVTILKFQPGNDKTPRLKAHGGLYSQFRIRKVVIRYRPTTGTATNGLVTFAVIPGLSKHQASITSADAIMKLAPRQITPVFRPAQLVVTHSIEASRWLVVNDDSVDGTSFTLAYASTADTTGYMEIVYSVEFRYPNPF